MLHDARAPDNPALVRLYFGLIPCELRGRLDRRRRLEPGELLRLIKLWRRFTSNLDALLDDDGEELVAEFGIILHSQYSQLRAFGVMFCESFIGAMEQIKNEIRDSDEDGDRDDSDLFYEADDPDEDWDTSDFEPASTSVGHYKFDDGLGALAEAIVAAAGGKGGAVR